MNHLVSKTSDICISCPMSERALHMISEEDFLSKYFTVYDNNPYDAETNPKVK